MKPRTLRIARAIATTAMPAGDTVSAPDDEAAQRLDAFIDATPRLVAIGYTLMLWALELLALPLHLRVFSALGPEQRARYLDRWASAGNFWVRIAFRGALTPIKICHYADEEVARAIGYDPPHVPPPPDPEGPWLERIEAADDHAGETLHCQVVVVGTGPGGAVMASRLAERGVDVVLLEEGRFHRTADFNRRPLQMMSRMYRDLGMTVALGVPGIPIPLGKTVGGTSTINSGTCFRAPDRVLHKWRHQYSLEMYEPSFLAPHYEELEEFLQVQPVPEHVRGNVAALIARGCDVLGYSHGPLMRNAEGCQGSGCCCFGCPTGAKRSMNVSFIPRALNDGARLFTGARVETILRKGRRATGVVASTRAGAPLTVIADAVVIACGTIYTPPLLMRNRIGAHSGELGNNMTIHPAAKVAGIFDEAVNGWEGVPQGYAVDHFHDQGIMFEGASVPPEFGAVGIPQLGRRFTEIMEQYRHLAFFGFLIEDTARGTVRPGPGGMPRIQYSSNEQDLEKLKLGTEILSRIFFAAGAHTVLPPVAGIEELYDVAELPRLRSSSVRLGDFELTAFHPLGTARMGISPHGSVVDPGLETWDVDRLFVSDGSVMPSSLGVNPQMTIMAVTSSTAEHVAARLDGAPRFGAGRSSKAA